MTLVERARRMAVPVLATGLLALFLTGGAIGLVHYLRGYWLYRGFPPPVDPAFVTATGTAQRISVVSPALGGRSQEVLVYLPPGYASHPHRRYPVFYLLHGVPGVPTAFLLTVRAGVVEDVLLARHKARPMILVMPMGSTGQFTDKEWVNGVRPHEGWATFMSRDVVRAIDARYRTIRSGAGRAIGGLSEGGYGAIDIALHHPREFRVVESWSGYQLADPLPSIFGHDRALIAANSPLLQLRRDAKALRRAHDYFWFYSGASDPLRRQNAQFARLLATLRIPYRYRELPGGHNWALWRDQAAVSLLAAARRIAHA
jgi:enterochelin esterase-like enzyme